MKLCTRCKSSYTDDSLMYCLQDGSPLVYLSDENSQQSHRTEDTLVMDENVTRDPHREPTEIMEESVVTQEQRIRPLTNRSESHTAPPKQNTALIIVLTILVMLIFAVLAVGGLWFLFKDRNSQPVSNVSDKNLNLNQNKDTDIPYNKNNPEVKNPGATPTPTPKPIDTKAIRADVTDVLNGWSSAAKAHDMEAQLRFYADTVSPYYNASSWSLSKIRAERERVYALYDTMDVDLTNIKITPDPSGEKATVIFDKTWTFEGETKFNSGSVQQKLWLEKISGRWRITGEKDLKIYYINKE